MPSNDFSNSSYQWHALEAEDVLDLLKTDLEYGLNDLQASSRLSEYGSNTLPSAPKPGALIRFLKQFNNYLIYILLFGAAVTAVVGQYIDTAVILAVVIINAVIGFTQENRAEEAMDSIRRMLALKACVQRGGQRREVPAEI